MPNESWEVPVLDNDGAPTDTYYQYAKATAPGQLSPAVAHTHLDFTWTESDTSEHSGTEYHFPPESGLPYLRCEWYPRTDGVSYGVGFLFMATATPATGGGPSDYSFAEADKHPDNEQHYRDVLYEPWNQLFPDKESVTLDDGTVVTLDDAIAEMVRRYRNWLNVIHPNPVDSLTQQANDLKTNIDSLVQQYTDVAAKILDLDPQAAVPGLSIPNLQE